MWAGHEMTPGDPRRRQAVNQFLNVYVIPNAIEIKHSTRSYYGQILGRIWKARPPASDKTSTDKHLFDHLGANLNDIWIVASAWEHGLVLLTKDRMALIRPLVTEVTYDCWI